MNDEHVRALTLRNIAEFEKTSWLQVPQISAVAFMSDVTYVTTRNGLSAAFSGEVTHENLAQLMGSIGLQGATGTNASIELEQWYETLLDLSSYPSYFEDFCPGLEPNIILRLSDCVIFSFVKDGKIVQYQYKFDPENQFPLALPDEVRSSFFGNYAAGPFLTRM